MPLCHDHSPPSSSSFSSSSAFTFPCAPFSLRLSISVSKLRQKQRCPHHHLSPSLQFALSLSRKRQSLEFGLACAASLHPSLSLSLPPPTSSLRPHFLFWSWYRYSSLLFTPSFFLPSPCLLPLFDWQIALGVGVHSSAVLHHCCRYHTFISPYSNLIQTDFHFHRGLPDNPDRLQEE